MAEWQSRGPWNVGGRTRQVVLDVNDPNSATAWLAEFYDQSEKQAARKGYDQHWNKEGFIHAGPADRLPNSGAAKMAVFIGDMLVKREVAGDAEAGQFLNFIINFLQNHRQTVQNAANDKVRREYEALLAAGKVEPVKARR